MSGVSAPPPRPAPSQPSLRQVIIEAREGAATEQETPEHGWTQVLPGIEQAAPSPGVLAVTSDPAVAEAREEQEAHGSETSLLLDARMFVRCQTLTELRCADTTLDMAVLTDAQVRRPVTRWGWDNGGLTIKAWAVKLLAPGDHLKMVL